MNSDLNESLTSTPLGSKKGLIPLQVGISSVDLTQESAKELIDALEDWFEFFDKPIPYDLARFKRLLQSLS